MVKIAYVLLFLAFGILLTRTSIAAEKPKLVLILPLSGKAAVAGEAARLGAVLAAEELGNPMELVFEDNALDNAQTATIVKRALRDHKGLLGIIVYASGPSNVAAPHCEAAKVPMIGLSVDPAVSRNRGWVMIHWASNRHVTDALIDELKRRKISTVAVITTQVSGLVDLDQAFVAQAREEGITVTFHEEVLPAETDFRTLLLRISKKTPDALFMNVYYGQAGAFASQAKELGVDTQLFSQFVLDNESEVASAREALEGAFFANTALSDETFVTRYKARSGHPPILGAVGGHDSVLLFSNALRDVAKQPINVFLHTVRNFAGAAGVYGAGADNAFEVPAELKTIKDGKITAGP